MIALFGGYATALAAMLVAATAALTIVRYVDGLDSTDQKPAQDDAARKVAA